MDVDLFDLFRDEFKPAKAETVKAEQTKEANVPADNESDNSGELVSVGVVSDTDNVVSDTTIHPADNLADLFASMSEEDHALIDSYSDSFIEDEKEFVEEFVAEDYGQIESGEDEEGNLGYYSANGEFFPLEEEMIDGGEVLTGEIVPTGKALDIPVEVLEGEVIHTSKDTVSALQAAMDKLAELEAVDREFDESTANMRNAINEMQKSLDKLKSEYARKMDERHVSKRKVADAQTEVSEEAHKEAERQREEEIKKQRKESLKDFHRDIKELNPEWYGYAFDHQWEGAATLALHGSGLLADEMGLGKTLSAIMWLDMVKGKRNLIITPNDTNSNFTMEIAMWARHRFTYTLAGADKAGRHVMWDMVLKPRIDSGEDMTLSINYEQLYSDTEYFEKLMEVEWDTIIIDEAHNFKKQSSLLFNRIKMLKKSNTNKDETSADFGKSNVKVLPMTGTFILNKPEDIWPALHLIDEDAFPNIKQFRDFYCTYNYYESAWEFRTGGERSLLIALGGRIVKRNMLEAGIILPKQHIHRVEIEFKDNYNDQRRIMRQLAEHSQIILDSDRKVSIVEQIALITRQRQAAVCPAGIKIKDPETGEVVFSVGEEVKESIKIDWTVDKIMELRQPTEEFPNGQRIAVFSQFKTALAELEAQLILLGIRVIRYDGDSTNATKMLVKRDFDRKHVEKTGNYEYDVVLCNYKTGGVGLNFTHATQLIAIDEEWNPGKNNQAYARTNRIGQTQENHVWVPELKGSIDRWMRDLNDRKKDLIDGFDSEVDLQKGFSDFLDTVKDI